MLFWKQSLDCPVLQTGDEALIRLYLFLRKRARVYGADITIGSIPVRLRRNELVFGRNAVGKALDLHPSRVYRKLQKLLKLGVLQLTQKVEGKFSIYQFKDRTGINDTESPSTKEDRAYSHLDRTQIKKSLKPIINTSYKTKLTEKQIKIDEPFLLKNDLNNGIQRYGKQFLDWLVKQARQKAKVNWIGLLITMLREGKVVGEYADQKKELDQRTKEQKALKEIEIKRIETERKQVEEEEKRIESVLNHCQLDISFKNRVLESIESQIPSRLMFVKRIIVGEITAEKILNNRTLLRIFELRTDQIDHLEKGK